MVGRDVNAVASRMRESCVQDEVVLRVEGLGRKGVFEDISFELKKGEILGFAGLVGAGRTEVMRAIFGADAKHTGTICLKGKEVNIRNTQDALRLGIGLLPEERKTQGFVNMMTNIDNTALSSIEKYLTNRFVDDRKKRKNYLKYENELNINPKKPDYLTQNMSGGNQQKIILARWMSTNVDILIFDEPTKGVDVAAKAEIYRLMEDIVHSGKSIIVVSSELPEVMGISDRMVIMCEGKKTGELQKEEFAEQVILNYAMGGKDNGERK
jgi:ribose transport system ATP-binding protein